MARIEFKGIDQYISALNRLSSNAEETMKRALYDGAGVVADQIKASLGTIQTRDGSERTEGMAAGPTAEEKASMISGFGLAKMRTENGYISTKAGFTGTSSHRTKSFPGGVPNALIARSVESGTSWMRKQPVIRRAANSSKAAAEAKMAKTLETEIKKIMN